MATCSICFDSFNASTRKPILCPFDSCSKTACASCYKTFLCGDDVSVPKCLFCNTQFTHSQLQHLGLTKSFLTGDFAKHQQHILFAQEQAMLPSAQAAVVHDKLVQNINDQIKDVNAQIKALTFLKFQLTQTKRQLMRNGPTQDTDSADSFIHHCADSNCNGFVSSAWKCATCEKYTCAHCREVKAARDDPDHVCNPDSVASVALLKNDTKPCPNCKVLVHKTEGCDQMFCTQCKRLWSWNTGRFETHGHNPHYLQWMRENHSGGMPREPGDVLCGREIDHHFLMQLHNNMTELQNRMMDHKVWTHDTSKDFSAIYGMLGSIPHLRFDELPRYSIDRVNLNLNARKAFVSNEMTLHRFKQTIRRNHLLAQKNEQISQIIHAVIQATTDVGYRVVNTMIDTNTKMRDPATSCKPDPHIWFSFAQELFNLKTYLNSELAMIHSDFQSSPSHTHFFSCYNFNLVRSIHPYKDTYNDVNFAVAVFRPNRFLH